MSGPLRGDWRGVVGVVSGGHFLSHFYHLALPPLFPLLRGEFGLDNVQLGLLASAIAVGGLLQAPVGGIVDRVGATRVFVVGLALTAGGIAAIGAGTGYVALLALALLSGVGQSAFHPADYTLIEAATDPRLEGRAFSLHTFSGIAGFAAAPLVVGALGAVVGWRATLLAVGAVGVTYAVVAALLLRPGEGEEHRAADATDALSADESSTADGDAVEAGPGPDASFRATFARPAFLAVVGYFFVSAVASRGVQTFTTLLAVDGYGLGEAAGNALLTAFFAVGAVGVLVGGVLADRYEPGRIIGAGLLVGSTLLVLTVLAGAALSTPVLVALFGLVGFFAMLVTPSRDRLVSRLSSGGNVGQSFGVAFTGGTVGALAGPVLFGAVSDAATIPLAFVVVAGFYLAGGLLAYLTGRRWLAPSG